MTDTAKTGEPAALFCSPPEAAEMLGISATRVYDACRSGEIGTVRLGARWRIPLPEVSRFGAAHGLIDDKADLETRVADLERDVAQLRRSVEAVFGYAVDIANPAKTESVER